MAHNKIKELRSVLQDNQHIQDLFIEQLKKNEKILPDIVGWEGFAKQLWDEVKIGDTRELKTPYVDAIELMDYILPGLE